MAHYTFEYVRGGKGKTRVFKIAVEDYDRMKALLESRGWERVIDPPASISVGLTMSECMNESIEVAEKNDRGGWVDTDV